MLVGGLVKMRSTGYKTAIKRELVRLDCKKSIKFCALLASERSNCVDHKKQRQSERVGEQGVRWGGLLESGEKGRGDRESEAVRECSIKSRGPCECFAF